MNFESHTLHFHIYHVSALANLSVPALRWLYAFVCVADHNKYCRYLRVMDLHAARHVSVCAMLHLNVPSVEKNNRWSKKNTHDALRRGLRAAHNDG